MKKVAVFNHHHLGGAVVLLHGVMKMLKAMGYHLDLYRFNKAGEDFSPLSSMADECYEIPVFLKPRISGHCPIIREYVNAYFFWRNLRSLDQTAKILAKEIDRKNYDFVFIGIDQYVKIPHLTRYLKTRFFLYLQEPERLFYDPPALFHDELENDGEAKPLVSKIVSIWYKPAIALFHYLWKKEADKNFPRCCHGTVLANSYFSAEKIFMAYGYEAKVFYPAIDLERFVMAPTGPERGNFVLTVGSLTANKGHAFVVRALSLIPKDKRPRWVVVVDCCREERRKNLIRLCENLEVQVEIRERVSEKELCELYGTAKVFVYGSRLEPFGMAPLEAMAMGLPVVAVKSGGVRETVLDGEVGFLSDFDPQEFASKVLKLIKEEDLWKSMSQKGKQYVRDKWNWEIASRNFEKILERSITVERADFSARVDDLWKRYFAWRPAYWMVRFKAFFYLKNWRQYLAARTDKVEIREFLFRCGARVKVYDSFTSWRVFDEIFVTENYRIRYGRNKKIVVDVGAHIGLFSLLAHMKMPNSEVHAIEANPYVYEVLERTARQECFKGKIYPYHFAIQSQPGTLTDFYISKMSGFSSLYPYNAEFPDEKVEVQSKSFSQFCQDNGITKVDLFKMDIEGGEYNVILEDPNFFKIPIEEIWMEVHNPPRDHRYSFDQLVDSLQRRYHSVNILYPGYIDCPLIHCRHLKEKSGV
ncbi:MAG: FkbM family methyltransferase [Candidatus Omnitrophica bacterium]|nr:FkbM family methyltransferase [Candidatus Omnitrophota bacterium]